MRLVLAALAICALAGLDAVIDLAGRSPSSGSVPQDARITNSTGSGPRPVVAAAATTDTARRADPPTSGARIGEVAAPAGWNLAPEPPPDWVREALGPVEEGAPPLRTNRQNTLGAGGLDPMALAVLEDLILANDLDESSSPFDYDDGDGVLEPWELGYQVWRGGELVLLSAGPGPQFSFGYELSVLPPSVGDLAAIEYLDLQGNQLSELPAEIGRLHTLRELRLHHNRLIDLPPTIGDLVALERLYVAANSLASLRSELAGLERLEALNAGDNPLTLIEDGALALPRLRELGLERSLGAIPVNSDSDGSSGLLYELPGELASTPLEELRVGGLRLYCGASLPSYLLDGSIARVIGLAAQRCVRIP
ncbi:MAG: leucine-rich repeat domain-containing protein [Myxococcota bacterium]